MTALTTLQSCPSCSSPMVRHVVPTNHDRPGVVVILAADSSVWVWRLQPGAREP